MLSWRRPMQQPQVHQHTAFKSSWCGNAYQVILQMSDGVLSGPVSWQQCTAGQGLRTATVWVRRQCNNGVRASSCCVGVPPPCRGEDAAV